MSIFHQGDYTVECTANKGPMRIQYKCLVPIYVFPEMKLLFPKQDFNFLSPSSFTHISVRDLYVYYQDQSAYSAAWKGVDRSWEYINCSQTHECGNWDWGRAVPRKGIHKWDFPCSVFHQADYGNALQMKGRWESNINVWFQFMYFQKWNCMASLFPEQNLCRACMHSFFIDCVPLVSLCSTCQREKV